MGGSGDEEPKLLWEIARTDLHTNHVVRSSFCVRLSLSASAAAAAWLLGFPGSSLLLKIVLFPGGFEGLWGDGFNFKVQGKKGYVCYFIKEISRNAPTIPWSKQLASNKLSHVNRDTITSTGHWICPWRWGWGQSELVPSPHIITKKGQNYEMSSFMSGARCELQWTMTKKR